jgi:hypothetical protein
MEKNTDPDVEFCASSPLALTASMCAKPTRATTGRTDYAFFDVQPIGNQEFGYQEFKVIRRVNDEDW